MAVRRHHFILLSLIFIVSLSLVYYCYNVDYNANTYVVTEGTEHPAVIDKTELSGVTVELLSPIVLSFLSMTASSGANVFLIEPCILWEASSSSQKNRLVNRKAVKDAVRTCNRMRDNITTVAAFEDDLLILLTPDFGLKLLLAGYTVQSHSDPHVRSGKTTHLIITKENAVIHVVIFYQRNSFLQIHALPDASFAQKHDLRFGNFDAAFENITLAIRKVNKQQVMIPDDHVRFLFEMPHSQFLECRHDLAAKHNRNYPLTRGARTDLISSLEAIRNVTYKTLLPVWMDGGSLIGWARHCGAVPYERDADFACHSNYLGNDWELAKEIVAAVEAPWYFMETMGLPWTAYEMRLFNVKLRWQVDLFFMTPDEEDETQVYSGFHTFAGIYYLKVYYNKTMFGNICSGEVLGYKIHIPCDYEQVLETEYGKEWVTPDERQYLKYQPRQHRTYWDEKESTHAYQCLGWNETPIRDDLKFTDYKWSERREKMPPRMNQTLVDVMYESTDSCARLRWDWMEVKLIAALVLIVIVLYMCGRYKRTKRQMRGTASR